MESLPELRAFYGELHSQEKNSSPDTEILLALLKWEIEGEEFMDSGKYSKAQDSFEKALTKLSEKSTPTSLLKKKLCLFMRSAKALSIVKGYAANEVGKAYFKAQEIACQLDDLEQKCSVLRGLCSYHMVRADLDKASLIGEKLVQLAKKEKNDSLLVEAYICQAIPLCYMGDFTQALPILAEIIEIYKEDPSISISTPDNPIILSLCFQAIGQIYKGFVDTALNTVYEALDLAKHLTTYDEVFVLLHIATIYMFREEPEFTLKYISRSIEKTKGSGIGHWLAVSEIIEGWAIARVKDPEVGIVLIERGMEKLDAGQSELAKPLFLGYLAECYSLVEKYSKALALIEEGLQIVGRLNEYAYESDLSRRKGEIFLAQGKPELAKESLKRSLQIAREQGLKYLELRALIHLFNIPDACPSHKERTRKLIELFEEGIDNKIIIRAREICSLTQA